MIQPFIPSLVSSLLCLLLYSPVIVAEWKLHILLPVPFGFLWLL